MTQKKPEIIKNSPIYSPIWTDIYRKDLDALIAVCGRRGNCKSGAAMRFGEDFDIGSRGEHRFNEDHIFFKASEFVAAMQLRYPRGTVLVWDEVGVENDSRSWYTLKNKLIKYVMETNRYKNYVVLVTVPTLKSIDIATQRLLSAYIEMHGKAGDGSYARGKFEYVQTNPKTGKAYYKGPRYWNEKKFYVLGNVDWHPPSKGLWDKYMAKKDAYTLNLWKNVESEIGFMSKMLGIKQEELEAKTLDELERDVLKNPKEYYNPLNKKFLTGLLETNLPTSGQRAMRLAQLLNWKLRSGKIVIE